MTSEYRVTAFGDEEGNVLVSDDDKPMVFDDLIQTDNRYGTFKYGTSHKYGGSAKQGLLYGLLVDWTGTGYTGENEAKYLTRFAIERGRDGPFSTNSKNQAQLNRNRVGTCSFTLDNADRRYDPWYTSSPLYPNVKPGRRFKFFVQDGSTGPRYDLIRGTLDVPQITGGRANAQLNLTGADDWQLLSDVEARVALRQTTTVDQTIGDILTAVGFAGGSDLDTGSDTIPYLWANVESAYKSIHELTEMDSGNVWIAGDGQLHFVSRTTLAAEAATFTLGESQVLASIVLSQPWDYIRNKIHIKIYPRIYMLESFYISGGSKVAVWFDTAEAPITIAAGQTLSWDIKFDFYSGVSGGTGTTYNKDPRPVLSPGVVYDCRENADGSGAIVGLTLVATYHATGAKISLTNPTGSTAYIVTLQVTAYPVDMWVPSAYTTEDATSETEYSTRELVLDNPYVQSLTQAQTLATSLVKWKDPYPMLTVEIVNRPTIQFAYDLGTRLTFTSAYYNINQDFRICKIRHEPIGPTLQVVKTTWTLEPIPS